MEKKVVYIAHPIGGDVENNIKKVIELVGLINRTDPTVVPFAPYIVDCLALDDNDPAQRARGIENNVALFKKGFIDEVWLCGPHISSGMQAERELALALNIPVLDFTLFKIEGEL